MQNILKNKSLLYSIIGVVVLVAGIIVALQLLPQEQDTRQQAAVQGGVAKMMVSPATLSIGVNESKPVKVTFSTGGKKVSNISVYMKYPFTAGNQAVNLEGLTISPTLLSQGFACGLQKIETVGNLTTISVICTPGAGGFTASSPSQQLDLFSFTAKGLKAGSATVSFDTTETTINEAQPGADSASDVLDIPANLSITVTGSGTPAPTPTPTPSPTPTPTPTPDGGSSTTTKSLSLSLSDLACGGTTFKVKATAKDNSVNTSGVSVTFSYNGETKSDTTDINGEAEVQFNRASSDKAVTAEAGGYSSTSKTANLPTGCSSSSTSSSTSTTTTTTTGVSCNLSCDATRDCQSGLSCVGGVCRADQCSSDSTCACADLDVAAQNGDTELPESGFDQTLAMSVLGLIFLLGGGQLLLSFRVGRSAENNNENE